MACGPLRWAAALVARGLRAHPRRFRPLPPARALGCNGAALSWSRSGAGGDLGGDDAEEELEALLGPVLLPLTGVQRMFVVQPRAGGLKRRRAGGARPRGVACRLLGRLSQLGECWAGPGAAAGRARGFVAAPRGALGAPHVALVLLGVLALFDQRKPPTSGLKKGT